MSNRDKVPWRDSFRDAASFADTDKLFRMVMEWTIRLRENLYFSTPVPGGTTACTGTPPTSTTPTTITPPTIPDGAKGATVSYDIDFNTATNVKWSNADLSVTYSVGRSIVNTGQILLFDVIFAGNGTFTLELGASVTAATNSVSIVNWIY